MSNETFIENYADLLIVQYRAKPKATAEISLLASQYCKVFSMLDDFALKFDLDTAGGDQQDLLGKIVGISREVPNVVPKIFFGFENEPNTRGFADFANPGIIGAPFFDLTEPAYTALQLNDADYRFFMKAKIAINTTYQSMVSDIHPNAIVEQIGRLFQGFAFVIDNFTMTLVLQVSYEFDTLILSLVKKLQLLPRPQGVRYNIRQIEFDNTFAFLGYPDGKGFGDVNNPTVGGLFASIVT